jgi:thiamine kinase-like enzyme
VTQIAAKLKIGPQLIASDREQQKMVLEYIDCKPWPAFEENSAPYHEAMRLLRKFHNKSPKSIERKDQEFAPFSISPFSIIDRGREMVKEIQALPRHFAQAIEKVASIFHTLSPWLKANATFCHVDFHKKNALFDGSRVLLIDWETTRWGDPLLDVVKFSLGLDQEVRMQLYATYLGPEHELLPSERAHFQMMDLTLLAVVAVIRMRLAYSAQLPASEEMMSREKMEQLLDHPSNLPSFLSIPDTDRAPKDLQRGALYALAEFAQKTETSSFEELLKVRFEF